MPKKPFSFRFLLFDGFSNMVLASVLEPLRAARNMPFGLDLSWTVATPSGEPARSSSGLVMVPDSRLEPLQGVTHLVVVSGYGVHDHGNAANLARLRRVRKAVPVMVGVDSGPWLLAAAGLLKDQEATIHWQEFGAFAEAFPEISLSKQRFVVGKSVITCGGAASAMDMVLSLLRENYGPSVAFEVSNLFAFDGGSPSGRAAGVSQGVAQAPGGLRSRGSQKLRIAVRVMFEAMEKPVPLSEIAARASISLRSLNRIFANELEMPPGRYYQMLRLTRARDLASETDLSLNQIAFRTGFSSAATLSRAFSAHYGWPISQTRKPGRRL